jgi:hypothetical protein
MIWRLAADAVLVLHLGFIVFALLGALLALRWRWIVALHLPAALWAMGIELGGGVCPLTHLEQAWRRRAGQRGYTTSFIEHHLLGVIYPDGLTREVQFVLAGVVVALNAAIYLLLWRRGRLQRRR